MGAISGMGTTYNLPNYTGLLYQLTPTDTPFFSAIGGLSGGGQSSSTEFEWQTTDLRSAAQPAIVEGADAPSAIGRTRDNVTNVCQIHQSQISVSYTKLAAVGQKAGSNNDLTNPVRNELDFQTQAELISMVRDIEFSFINGAYQKPSDNTTARRTRGLLAAIATNTTDWGVTVSANTLTVAAATDLVAETSTPLANGDQILIRQITGGAPLAVNTVYFVVEKATNAFKLSLTKGGPAINVTADGSAIGYTRLTPLTYDMINAHLQSVYDNGGIMQSETAALMVPSHLKVAVSKALADVYGKYNESSRTVGGVDMTTVITDFGTLNVITNRHMPKGTLAVVSLDQCMPVYLEVPGKGHFFAEPLARTGAAERVQLYGEVGLAYGNERAHGKLTNVGSA